MGVRKAIRRIFEQSGGAGLWKWAKGHGVKRWKALSKWSGKRSRELKVTLTKRRKTRDRIVKDLHDLHDEQVKLHDARERVIAEIAKELQKPVPDAERIASLEAERKDLHTKIGRFNQRIHSKEVQKKREVERIHQVVETRKWFVKSHTVYRRKMKRAKRRAEQNNGVPKWESWMANGRDARVTDAVKQEMAYAVVIFDLAVTSLYRATVIPQSNPNSYHGPNINPGQAGDVAGPRMTEYQINVYGRRRGNCKECFGPSNTHCLKNGAPMTLAEGTFLENLHDSHTHVAP